MTVFIAVCFSKKSRTQTYILMVQYVGAETGDEILRELNKTRYQVKSKILRNELTEMTIQVECRDTQMVMQRRYSRIQMSRIHPLFSLMGNTMVNKNIGKGILFLILTVLILIIVYNKIIIQTSIYIDENEQEILYNPLIGYAVSADYPDAVGENTLGTLV